MEISEDIIQTSLSEQPLRMSVIRSLQNYFLQLGDQPITNLYQLVMAEVEGPLLEIVMKQVKGNQSKAAIMLGISRGTLRKLLKQYNLS